MGRLEKIVVLTVLFLVAVVLGVALTPTGEKGAGDDQRGPVEGALAPEGDALPAAPDRSAPGTDNRLLSATADLGTPAPGTPLTGTPKSGTEPKQAPQGPPVATPPAPGPVTPVAGEPKAPAPVTPPAQPAPYVLTTEGLVATGMADTMQYAWQAGDTFAGLAVRYYGSKDKESRLAKANEGRAEASLALGDRIWVPVAESAKGEAGAADEQVYVVKAGDMLGSISQKYYGTAKKWQKILDANRDTLASPEKLRPGMKLRIPE